ncbi:MAG: SIS domain-containing protein [bacterium]|nr:SIS domain-containing protein [bacterium]
MFDIKEQLKFKPEVLDLKVLNFDNVVVGGMGGSALPARAIFYLDSVYPIWLHNDYGLPKKIQGKPLFVAISYSGNTRETISFAKEALGRGLPLAVITSGGTLKDLAEGENIARVLVPENLEPRDALVYMLKSLLLILGRDELIEEIEKVDVQGQTFREISDFVSGGIPLIYSPTDSSALAYIWKIYLNESAKMPAFCNSFPEVFHNELESINESHRIIVFTDGRDMGVKAFLNLAEEKGWHAKEITLGVDKAENLIRNFVMARSVARNIAESKGVDPDKVPVIEEFKKLK